MRIAALTLLLGSLCLAACDETNNEIVVPGTRTGNFILQSVNGRALPAIILDTISQPLVVEVISGAIAIGSNHTFVDITGFRLTLGDIVSTRPVACSGTFTVARDTLTFVESGAAADCGHTFTGVLSGNSLTTSIRGTPVVYVR